MSKLKDLKYNFFKSYAEWANTEVEMFEQTNQDKVLINRFNDFDLQPYNSVFKIGNRMVQRMFMPTNEQVIVHEITIDSKYSSNLLSMNDFDAYITLRKGDLVETLSGLIFEPNIIYLIPAGNLYNLKSLNGAEYYATIKNKENLTVTKDYINKTLENRRQIEKIEF